MGVNTNSVQATIDEVVNNALEKEGLTWEQFAYQNITEKHVSVLQQILRTSPVLCDVNMLSSYKTISLGKLNKIKAKI